jgi:hypothetical protein
MLGAAHLLCACARDRGGMRGSGKNDESDENGAGRRGAVVRSDQPFSRCANFFLNFATFGAMTNEQ